MVVIKNLLTDSRFKNIPLLDKEVLLADSFKKGRDYLVAHSECEVPIKIVKKVEKLYLKRQKGVPLAYLIKKREFFGLDFYVDKRVLIPRPETELLVEETKNIVKKLIKKKIEILEVGTGSGCIAISLAKSLSEAKVTAVDISKAALEVAKINVKKYRLGERIILKKSNLLKKVKGQKFDIIVANLPYISPEGIVDEEVRRYEPSRALFAGLDGLKLYQRLFREISLLNHKPAFLLIEFGFGQKEELLKLAEQYFLEEKFLIKRDFAGIERLFIVEW